MNPRALAALIALCGLAAVAEPAAAQSTRYRKPPVEVEIDAESYSDFWEEVLHPGANRYELIIAAAADLLANFRGAEPTRVFELLREAVELRPDRIEGWGYLGLATERNRDYRACAMAYGRAYALDPTWRPLGVSGDGGMRNARSLALAWAVCLARHGDYARAARQLESLVARGEVGTELFLNLGQLQMATGRINDAIASFRRALDERVFGDPTARWLLAIAYDRARRTGDAALAIEAANDLDPGGHRATNTPVPLVPPTDALYILGLAARSRADQPQPENAAVYFRGYLAGAPPDSPWRERAREHLSALGNVDLAARLTIEGAGTLAPVQGAVRPVLARLQKCMTELPTALIELRMTLVGPTPKPTAPAKTANPGASASKPAPAPRPGAGPPPEAQTPGVHSNVVFAGDSAEQTDALDEATRCVVVAAQEIDLPRPPAGTYMTVRVPIIATP